MAKAQLWNDADATLCPQNFSCHAIEFHVSGRPV